MAKARTKVIGAAKFKEHCLSLIENVDSEGIVITKNGRPVAKLIPIGADRAGDIGRFAGLVKVKGDIFSTGLKWDAES